jgi:hypothetical protein
MMHERCKNCIQIGNLGKRLNSIKQVADKISIIERRPAKCRDEMVRTIVAVLVTAVVTYFFEKLRRGNSMFDFLKLNWLNILIVIVVVFSLVYLYRIGKRNTVKEIILSLVIQAEKALGSGTGDLKYAMVVERAYVVLPTLIRFLITKKELDNLIEEAVKYMKLQLSDGNNIVL